LAGPPQRPRPRPSTPTLRPSGPGAHLSCPQRPTVVARALAVTGCRAAAHMGKKLSTARQQGALPLSKITGLQHVLSMHVCMCACEMGIMDDGGADPQRCAAQGRGARTHRVLDGVPHREHCSPGASTPCPTIGSPSLPPVPLATRTAALETSEAMLITREITRASSQAIRYRVVHWYQRGWPHCGPSSSHDPKRGCCNTCWDTQTVIWRYFLS
jgi:hypothetical protein